MEVTVSEDLEGVAALLHEAAETHHLVYRIVDGNDPDWASWYAEWLINLSELPQLLGRKPVRSQLISMTVRLDREFNDKPVAEPWERFYAGRLLEAFRAVPA